MNILELDSYNLADAVKFHSRLNPRIWGRDEHLLPAVREKLLAIAENFQEFLGVPDLNVKDITVSGSNAAYSYTPNSDIDLHLVVDMPADPVYQELFTAKKYQYNDEHQIRIGGADVELYVQPADQPHHSQGIYSVKNSDWIQVPSRKRAQVDDACVRDKVSDLDARIHSAVKSGDEQRITELWNKIKHMRQSGLAEHGEFGCENLAFKLLRANGCIRALKDAKTAAEDRALSLEAQKQPRQRVRYGFGESPDGVDPTTKMFLEEPTAESPDGVNPTTAMFLTEADPESIVSEFIQHTADRLGIKRMPEIHIHRKEDWSKQNHSFGMYVPERHELHVSLGNRHLLDILRTTAHELCHCAQHEQQSLPHNAGETGSDWENEAHAVAGIVMRDFADAHPEYFKMPAIEESASGYIPKNKREARDPRYSMAVTVDVKPGEVGRQANKLALHTGRNGEPGLLMKTVNLRESLEAEFAAFAEGKSYGYGSTPLTQEPGGIEDELGNQEATGPEFPPQMPAGTTKIDVSDLTDWYRLGMDISDMDDADPEDYNQGPPQTVIVFPSDEAEQGYLKQFKRLGLKTHDMDPDVAGGEDVLGKHLHQKLAEEFELFEEQDLFEIRMSTSSLRQEAAKTGALAGMEFEMIVPNVQSDPSDFEYEPDYDRDERCRSIEDAVQFFYDGDHNSRRDVEHLREQMNNDYLEWLDGKIESEWDNDGEEFIEQWVKNNVGEDEWNPDELEGDERNEALEEFAANVHADPMGDYYQQARDEFREERQEGWDESDWLDATDLDRMTGVYNAYSISWPYYTEPGDAGEAEISDVAQDFENAIGRDTWAADSYHSRGTLRPSPERIRYVVEPDGSLEPDNPGDRGLEFVSPPLPIDEILSDLNKVKKWARDYGCYTNDSTGLHINISVPNYSLDKLDFVKLALLMGDKYVLDLFGRSGNTYARSAFDIVKRAVRDFPEEAAKLLDKMKSNLDGLATKAIHSGVTQKYTSINTKDGHIEFRSPGGDWLDQNFDQIENTLLRFTVAMSAALNPEMYRKEYLTKLYKLLSENNKDVDTIKYFSDYVAGKIPKAALRSFVKQAQLERRLKRDPTEGERYWWRVDKEGRGRDGASIELVAASKKEALEKAREEWRIPAGHSEMRRAEAYPLRPYTDTRQTDTGGGLTLNGRPSNPDGRYVIVPEQDRQTVYYRFQAAGPDDANIVLRQWRQEHPGRIWLTLRDDNGVLGQPEGTGTPRFGLWDFGEGGFINSRGAVGQGGRLLGGDSFDAARAAARNSGLASRIDMGEVEIRRIPQEQPQNWRDQLRQHLQAQSATGTYELFDRRTGEAIPDSEFTARNQREVNTRLQDYIDFGLHGVGQTDAQFAFGARPLSSTGQITPTAPTQQGQGNWGIWLRNENRFSRAPNQPDNSVLRRFHSREAAEQFIAQARENNPNTRTDIEVREIEPRGGFQFELSQTDIENRLGWGGQAADANYEVVNRATMQPVFKFIANTPQEANTKYAQILRAMGMPPETEDYGYRDIVVPGSTIDLQRRRAAAATDNVFGITGQGSDRTDGRNINYSPRDLFGTNATADQQQGGIVDVATDVAQNFPSTGREHAGWRVLLPSGEEVYRFSGAGNSQADANRIAAEWLRNNGYGVSGEGYEVVPVWREV